LLLPTWAVLASSAVALARLFWIVSRSGRQATPPHRKCVDSSDILTVLALDNGANIFGGVEASQGRHVFDGLNLLLTRCDISGDRVLRADNVACSVVTPSDRLAKLLLVRLHRLGSAVDCSASGLRGIARPHMWTIEN
jgi:hypothetical protein